jgi:hypothetical protein
MAGVEEVPGRTDEIGWRPGRLNLAPVPHFDPAGGALAAAPSDVRN